MNQYTRLSIVLITAFLVAGCSTPGGRQFTESKLNCALFGGAAGAGVGSFEDGEAAVTGALIGAAIGAIFCGDEDTDGDGVKDGRDNCPGTPPGAPVDSNGCEFDEDGDGVVDSEDRCPGTPAGTKVDSRGCEMDSDGDGVADSADRCPNTPAGARVDQYGCEFDGDKDGVVDSRDRCPDTAPGTPVNNEGCDLDAEYTLEGVKFEFDSARLTSGAKARLDEAVAILKRHSDLEVEVAGHTDSVGDAGYNESLSQRRAKAVKDYLVSKGANASNLTAKGYGESQPVADNGSDAGRAQNRRVEFRHGKD